LSVLETTPCDSFAQSVGDKLLAKATMPQAGFVVSSAERWPLSGAQDMPDEPSAERLSKT